MQSLTLHQLQSSGNSWKIRLTAAILDLKISKLINYDVSKGETRTVEYLSKINANGRVPVLQIGKDKYLPESNAACYYLADASDLIPTDRLERAEMLRWMFFEQYSHEPNVATACYWTLNVGLDNLSEEQKILLPGKREQGNAALDVVNVHLSTRQFMVAERLTLADIVLYVYTEGARITAPRVFDLAKFPHIEAWCERIKKQPGYIPIEKE